MHFKGNDPYKLFTIFYHFDICLVKIHGFSKLMFSANNFFANLSDYVSLHFMNVFNFKNYFMCISIQDDGFTNNLHYCVLTILILHFLVTV